MNKNTYATFSTVVVVLALTILVDFTTGPSAWAQGEEKKQLAQVDASDTNARTWPQSSNNNFTIEPELFVGQRGYIHGGFEFEKSINEKFELGLSVHVVRENSEGSFFPSVGVKLTTEITEGFELTAFTFGYLPVEDMYGLGVGVRIDKELAEISAFGSPAQVSVFISPAYSYVKGARELEVEGEEEAEIPATVNHYMLFGGVRLDAEPVSLVLFGSHSFFSGDPVGVETRVDLGEMTQTEVYENTDGFAGNSIGGEIEFELTDWLSVSTSYAVIWLEGLPKRRSFMVGPSFSIGEGLEIHGGLQLLRGGEADNNLGVIGLTLNF